MTFTEISDMIKDRTGLSSTEAGLRIGKAINRVNRQVTSSLGMVTTMRDDPITANTTIGNRYVAFTCEKILSVFTVTDSVPFVLSEISYDEMRGKVAMVYSSWRWIAIV